tara:strand:- start:691 stop:1803 length:1113 start_codon:yes stop_codon:yes gene_type:complete
MNKKPLITIVFGTRPEAIKLAPVIQSFKKCNSINTRVIATGQHREMVKQVLDLFDIDVDKDLKLMMKNQSLNNITVKSLVGLEDEFHNNFPDLVLIQGDTTSAFSAGLSAFYNKIKVGHIEAGLRTGDNLNPFPEELNRRLISQISSLHFAPTEMSRANLIASDAKGKIFVTGNTIIDSLFAISKKNRRLSFWNKDLENKKIILATIHRRENWGKELERISLGLKGILDENEDFFMILPMHKNPIIRKELKKSFAFHDRSLLIEPLPYDEMVSLMKKCHIVVTDSGGIQEEAPSFGKPVLVLRKNTERQEALEAGTIKLIGTQPNEIIKKTIELISDKKLYEKMSSAKNPYGDGKSSERILKACLDELEV